MEAVGRILVLGERHDQVLERQERAGIDLEGEVEVERSAAGLLGVQVDLPGLPERVRLDEVALVVHVEAVVDGVVLQVSDEPGDVDGGHGAQPATAGGGRPDRRQTRAYDAAMLHGRARLLGSAAAVLGLVAAVVMVTDGDDEDASRVDTEVDDPTTTIHSRSSTTEGPTASTPPPTSSTSSTASSSTTRAAPDTTAPAPTAAPPTTSAPPPPADPFASARIRLTRVASLDYPIAMAVRPSDGSVWVARKGGAVCKLGGGSCTASQVVASVSSGNEQGLLGIAFNPAGSRFYASYTNPAGDTRLDEFPVRADGTADVTQRRNIFAEDQPEPNHNGGNIVFGPDGRLYLGLGDGGGGGDKHGPVGNAQDPSTDLGKILRIDPAGPTVERWISGVRNPWRFSFDRSNGDLWVADVGQGSWEEITRLPAGAQRGRNLGWRCYEGTHPYSGCAPAGGHTGPLLEYPHGPGCSITGGFVYRGSKIPALVGAYLYSDYCDGQIRGLTLQAGRVRTSRGLGVNPGNVVSFGQASNGDLFVLTPGAIFRIDPA